MSLSDFCMFYFYHFAGISVKVTLQIPDEGALLPIKIQVQKASLRSWFA